MKNIILLLYSLILFSSCEHEIAKEMGNEDLPVVAFEEKLLTNAFVLDNKFHVVTRSRDSIAYYSVITTAGELTHLYTISDLLPGQNIDTLQSIFFQYSNNTKGLAFSYLSNEEGEVFFNAKYYEFGNDDVPVFVCQQKQILELSDSISLIGVIRRNDRIKLATLKTLKFAKDEPTKPESNFTQLFITLYDNSGEFIETNIAPSTESRNMYAAVFSSGKIVLKNRDNALKLLLFDENCILTSEFQLNTFENIYSVIEVGDQFLISLNRSKTNFVQLRNSKFDVIWEHKLEYDNTDFIPTNIFQQQGQFLVLGTKADSDQMDVDITNPSDFNSAELALFVFDSATASQVKSFDTDSKIFGNAMISTSDGLMFLLASQFIFNKYTNTLLIKADRNGDII